MSSTKSLMKWCSEALTIWLKTMKVNPLVFHALNLNLKLHVLCWSYEKMKHNIINKNGKHTNQAKTGTSAKSSFSHALFQFDTFLLPLETSKVWHQNFVWKLAWCCAQLGSVVSLSGITCTCSHRKNFFVCPVKLYEIVILRLKQINWGWKQISTLWNRIWVTVLPVLPVNFTIIWNQVPLSSEEFTIQRIKAAGNLQFFLALFQ